MSAPSLSIVIPCFNQSHFTFSCLKDLFQLPVDHEIIVVDNGSTDSTQQELSAINRPNFRYIRNDVNLGFGKAVNKGIANSSGHHIMTLNNDIRVKSNHSNWTQPIIDCLNQEFNCFVGPTGGFVDPKTFDFKYHTNDPTKTFNYLSGWCLSATADVWDTLNQYAEGGKGPFCEDYFCFFEDCHLSWKATQLGMKLKLIDIPVTHFGHRSSKHLTGKLYTEARQIFTAKWSQQ
jgi:O-antigen biosynthesis protein